MYKPLYVLAAVASLAVVQTPAQALQLPGAGTVGAALADESGIEQAAYIYGRHSYCFYRRGWHGPGWYRCGYAFRRGLGWGGVYGWNSWNYPGVGLTYRNRGNWDRRHIGRGGNYSNRNSSTRRGGSYSNAAPSQGPTGTPGASRERSGSPRMGNSERGGSPRMGNSGSNMGNTGAPAGGAMNRGAPGRPSGGPAPAAAAPGGGAPPAAAGGGAPAAGGGAPPAGGGNRPGG